MELSVAIDESAMAKSRTVCLPSCTGLLLWTLSLQWGTVTQCVTGYETLLTRTQVACPNPDCAALNKLLPQSFGNCTVCDTLLQIAASVTEVVKDTVFDTPLQECYAAPILTFAVDDPTRQLLEDAAKTLKQQLYREFEEIPPWHEELLTLPPDVLGLHTLSHLLLTALPTRSQPIAASDLLRLELGQPPQLLLYDEAELGTGSCEFLDDQFEALLHTAYHLAVECDCTEGCPKCCHSSHCSMNNGDIYRPLGVAFLEAVLSS